MERCSVPPSPGTGQWRFWKDSTGQFQVEAAQVDVANTEVLLKKRDGRALNVPLLRLSKEDLEFLEKKRADRFPSRSHSVEMTVSRIAM